MPDVSEADRAILAQFVRERIGADRFPLSPRVTRLKVILAKLDQWRRSRPSRVPGAAAGVVGRVSFIAS